MSKELHPARRIFLFAPFALMTGLGTVACGGASGRMMFEGQHTINIVGEAPMRIRPAGRARLAMKSIEVGEKVQFALNDSTILPESFGLLDEVAAIIQSHPNIRRVSIDGHASADGNPISNLTLSDQRAHSVMTYLVTKGGINPARLSAQGYGDTHPIADNNTEEGRIRNRRVEFNIVESDPQ